ncbi:hypothetical protein EV699_1171 [Plasticicumulans lactativorans]|uniref:Uncharacterized protein n=1 Tax=Plasticicumulans lactativorans TaxID=1133106 RepID=A0A4R2L233_9GAMM|nr:hypothetical protein [Plasticicumulans lactativorans]TCO79692.1 hypothetical protein EV699_1171 [Plasticicumulans lactativorans]
MNSQLFVFALEHARSSDWEHFEELSSRFLASEFPELRTMANPTGDGGRDSELFSPAGFPSVVAQYSVSKDWGQKIRKTIKRLKEEFPTVQVLVYTTNRKIGASGDKIKSESIKQGLSLDIRDLSWFSERIDLDDNKYSAAKAFSQVVAIPLLDGQKIIEQNRPSLTTIESKAALIYLAMQWEDENTDKGLSKIVYEALVLSALRNTNSDRRMVRRAVHEAITGYLTSSAEDEVSTQVDAALRRLTKKKVRHWQAHDEFCLAHEEIVRLQDRLVLTENQETDFIDEVERLVSIELGSDPNFAAKLRDYRNRVVRVLDSFLLKTGEVFAASVAAGEVAVVDRDLLYNTVYSDLSAHPNGSVNLELFPDVALNVIARLCASKNDNVQSHLRKLSDSYTLFSFLRETPDVQKATKKIFGHGKIWLDTTIVLPLLAESFFAEQGNKRYTSAINNLKGAGVELRVTDGVVQELLSHIRVSQTCSTYSLGEWKGRIPYLYKNYIQMGCSPSGFRSAAEIFRGHERPEDDISDYLFANYGIQVESLAEHARAVDNELRYATERLWRKAHDERRGGNDESVSLGGTIDILIRHDVESYLGIVGLRKSEQSSELGYKHWWLTIDSVAWKIRKSLKEELKDKSVSPLMSLDFLLNSLSFGPARTKLARTHEQLLPILLDLDFSAYLPVELLDLADRIRKENEGAQDYVIKRKVRDACDRMRGKYGQLTKTAADIEQSVAGDA